METSTAVQDYVKAIYQLGGGDGPIQTSELASRLGVTPASVSAMLRRLHERGLAVHERYQGVQLTAAGTRTAVELIRHHRLLETYLAQVVGLPLDKVHGEAEVLEHVLSEELESRLDELLGYPTQDPHGHPIPSADLILEKAEFPALDDVEPGTRAVVRSVSDRRPDLLRHLAGLGIRPGAAVTVVEVVPFGGGVRLKVGTRTHVLGTEAAQAVSVSIEDTGGRR